MGPDDFCGRSVSIKLEAKGMWRRGGVGRSDGVDPEWPSDVKAQQSKYRAPHVNSVDQNHRAPHVLSFLDRPPVATPSRLISPLPSLIR